MATFCGQKNTLPHVHGVIKYYPIPSCSIHCWDDNNILATRPIVVMMTSVTYMYQANMDSLDKALSTLGACAQGVLVCVLVTRLSLAHEVHTTK